MSDVASPANDTIKLIMALLTNGFTVYFLRDIMLEIKAQMRYEKSFLNYYNEIMPGPPQDSKLLIPYTHGQTHVTNIEKGLIARQSPITWHKSCFSSKL